LWLTWLALQPWLFSQKIVAEKRPAINAEEEETLAMTAKPSYNENK